jgi:hypothetical protein
MQLSNMLSKDTRKSNEIKKLNEKGEYMQFEGMTVVMPLESDLSAMYEELKQVMPNTVEALLPLDSYHVTVTGIRCRFHFKTCDKYNEFLEQYLMAFTRLKKEIPVGKARFTLENPAEPSMPQITGHLKPADDETARYLQQVCDICERHLGKFFRKSRSHLTISYKIPSSRELTYTESKQIADILNKHLYEKVITFGTPALCKFNDMTAFIPV